MAMILRSYADTVKVACLSSRHTAIKHERKGNTYKGLQVNVTRETNAPAR